MSAAIDVRAKLTYLLLIIGVLLALIGLFSNSSWATLGGVLGVMLFAAGAVMFTSLSVVQGVPWLAQLISRHAESDWDGEIIHVEGSGLKVRYDFDDRGSPWFVVKDVCDAIDTMQPKKDDLKCGGVPVLKFGGHTSFSEKNIQIYLTSLALKNHAANRLLVNVRNNVLRKLEKEREDRGRYNNSFQPTASFQKTDRPE